MFCMLCRGPRLVGAGIMRAALGMMTTGGVLGWLPVGPRRCDLGTRTPTVSWHTQRLLYGTPGPTSIFGFLTLSIARSLLQVHKAWHAAGVAPELYSANPVGDGSMVMVVMEHLREEDGWKALRRRCGPSTPHRAGQGVGGWQEGRRGGCIPSHRY